MKLLEMDQCKERLIKMLLTFDEFCKEHHLTYYLAWGTLLGAIRHGGFIPWDDDLDISMPREDYMRLIELSKNWDMPFDFYCYEKDERYPNYFGKLSDKETILKNLYMDNELNLGLFIDIFPVDDIKIEKDDAAKLQSKLENLIKMLMLGNMKKLWPAESKIKTLAKAVVYNYASYLHIHADNPEDNNYSIHAWFVAPKTFTDEIETRMFEGYEFPCPKKYDEYLEFMYGDYMQLPPEEKRVSVHDYEVYLKEDIE